MIPHTNGPGVAWRLANWLGYRRRDLPTIAVQRILGTLPGIVTLDARLSGVVYRPDRDRLAPWQATALRDLLASGFDARRLPAIFGGQATDYGILSRRLVTTAGVNWLVDAFQGLVEPELARFHAYGLGTNAEAVGDVGLQTELTTQYATDNVRPTGTQTEGASANIYRSVAILAPDATVAITEHMLTTQAAVGGGICWDRSVFAAVNLTGGVDTFQTTHDTTIAAGG